MFVTTVPRGCESQTNVLFYLLYIFTVWFFIRRIDLSCVCCLLKIGTDGFWRASRASWPTSPTTPFRLSTRWFESPVRAPYLPLRCSFVFPDAPMHRLGNGVAIEASFFPLLRGCSGWTSEPVRLQTAARRAPSLHADFVALLEQNTAVRVSEGAASLWLTEFRGDRREANDPSLFTSPHSRIHSPPPQNRSSEQERAAVAINEKHPISAFYSSRLRANPYLSVSTISINQSFT